MMKFKKKKYDEIHIWTPLKANYEYGKNFKIMYTPNNNKYNSIYPNIQDNSFYIDIKGGNDAHILVEIENIALNIRDNGENNISENYFYEIVLGGWNNNISVIRDYVKSKIIASYENKILNKTDFTRFNISFNKKIEISFEENSIMKKVFDIEIYDMNENYIIKSVMIKSYYGGDIFWNYDFPGNCIYLCNNIYDENNIISNVYNKYYAEDYIEKIELISLIN